ncbi:MAG: tetratricopeptide repeat protein [Archangium sp.]
MARQPVRAVEIVYYPKKAKGLPVPRRAQTVETAITEIHEEPKVSKKARRTLTDESEDPSARAFAELTRLGHESFEAGRVDDARTVFESLIALGHNDPFTHTMLGTVHLGAGRLDDALAQFEAALSIDPDDVVALVYRGEIRLSKKKQAAALEDLERAARLGRATDPFVGRAKKLLSMARANRTA